MPNQDESNQALQSLILMNRKKIEIKKVWSNASPTSTFVAQQIPKSKYGDLNLLDYDFVGFRFWYSNTSHGECDIKWFKPSNGTFTYNYLENAGYATMEQHSREISVTADYISFGNDIHKATTSSNSGAQAQNYLIPVEIYVAKGVI